MPIVLHNALVSELSRREARRCGVRVDAGIALCIISASAPELRARPR